MRTPADVAAALAITPQTIATRLAAVGVGPADGAVLALAAPRAAAVREAFLDALYTRLRATPETAALLSTDAQVARLKAQQGAYLAELFGAELDWAYALRRLWIGVVHHRVRLSPQWYLATYAHIIDGHLPALFAPGVPPGQALDQAIALVKRVCFEASLVLDAYGRVHDDAQWAGGDAPSHDRQHEAATDAGGGAGAAGSPATAYSRLRLASDGPEARRQFLDLDPATLALVGAWRPIVEARMPAVLDEFYAFLQQEPAVAPLVPPPVAARLKGMVGAYWRQVTAGDYDQAHAASRMRIGVIHERHGLESAWYLASFARQITGVLQGLDPARADAPAMIGALVKALFFDVSFVIDAYMDARADRLLQVEGFVQQLVSSLDSAVAIVDAHDRLLSANRSLVQLAGGDAAVLYLLPLDRALPIEAAAPLVAALRAQIAAGGAARLAGRGRIGARRLRLTAVALSGEGGLEGTIALVVDDVTELVRVAEDMEDQRGHLARVASDVGVVLWDMDPATWTITAVNTAALDLTGWRDMAFLGVPSAWLERIVPRDRDLFVARLSALTPAAVDEVDYRWQRPDGTERWFRSRVRLAPDRDAGRFQGLTVDITDAKRRDQLHLDAIASTAGGVAHVVNNCLTAVIGSIEMLDLTAAEGTPLAYLRDALGATEKAAAMASQLVSFAGRQRLVPEVFSIGDAILAESDPLQATLGDAALVLDLAPGLWACRVDRRLFGAALQALAQNARQAMPRGGTLRIATKNLGPEALPGDAETHGLEWVECAVTDSGAGMSDEVRRRAFEPFFTTRSMAVASGLGLSMVYGFVTQSGGHVRLESRLGEGTTVRLRLPRFELSSEKSRPRRPLVLFVEDEQPVRVVGAAMMRSLGYRVAEAATVDEARRLAAETGPDLVVADIVLGQGTDGVLLVLELLRARPRLGALLTSGFARTSFDLSRLPARVPFLPKPFSLASLREALSRAEAGRPHEPESAGADGQEHA